MSDCSRLLTVLSDHKPHSHQELYGLGMIVHSRVSDLRAQGHEIVSWRERTGRDRHNRPVFSYFYRLTEDAPGRAASHPGEQRPEPPTDGDAQGDAQAPAATPQQLVLIVASSRPDWA